MEYLQRKHFSSWTIFLVAILIELGNGLQGVPTWICLGIKSPFVEFTSDVEILANTSISLNFTKDEQTLMHEQGLRKLGSFIKPVDIRNSSAEFAKSAIKNVSKEILEQDSKNPIADEMNRKNIDLIEEEFDHNNFSTFNDDRKYIIPMALKNPAIEVKKTPPTQDYSTNIDDLKNHILMLQNLTKTDKNFESKFVVFPTLQREKNTTQNIQIIPAASPQQPTRKISHKIVNNFTIGSQTIVNQKDPNKQKTTFIPHVLLLNDQTPPEDDVDDGSRPGERRKNGGLYSRREKNSNSTMAATNARAFQGKQNRQQNPRRNQRRRKKNRKQRNCKNKDSPRCQRLRREEIEAGQSVPPRFSKSPNARRNRTMNPRTTATDKSRRVNNNFKLSRTIRSRHHPQDSSTGFSRYESVWDGSSELIETSSSNGGTMTANNQSEADIIVNINPDLCLKVDALSYGQKKLCVLHTSIMPAISRGARSAIQECQYQFKSRRWNCSTVNDNTAFGPSSSIGSPEMAFIHALAAATATSFIARACRDGQLASCGCSRSSKPKQLADDWTWGGCGDDLEYAYKFSQNFIDIREKERRRGVRGLVAIPSKGPFDEKSLAQSNSTASGIDTPKTSNGNNGKMNSANDTDGDELHQNLFKPEDLVEKITKEIQNSKLEGKDILELQEKISREILSLKVFTLPDNELSEANFERLKNPASVKARSLMNLHNNEAGRRAVIRKTRITCKCHGVSGSCSLITCWQQLSSIREIGDYLREKYDEATHVKLNRRGRLQVKDSSFKLPTAHDLVYLDESPDWCRNNRILKWPGTHGRACNKTSTGLDGCAILCCGRGYNTKKIEVRERCGCKFHWCCQVKCDVCIKYIEEYTCK